MSWTILHKDNLPFWSNYPSLGTEITWDRGFRGIILNVLFVTWYIGFWHKNDKSNNW